MQIFVYKTSFTNTFFFSHLGNSPKPSQIYNSILTKGLFDIEKQRYFPPVQTIICIFLPFNTHSDSF